MSRAVKAKMVFLVLILSVLPLLEVGAVGPIRPAPEPCTYCSSDTCGCPSNPSCTLTYSCGCSTISCVQFCDYKC